MAFKGDMKCFHKKQPMVEGFIKIPYILSNSSTMTALIQMRPPWNISRTKQRK